MANSQLDSSGSAKAERTSIVRAVLWATIAVALIVGLVLFFRYTRLMTLLLYHIPITASLGGVAAATPLCVSSTTHSIDRPDSVITATQSDQITLTLPDGATRT